MGLEATSAVVGGVADVDLTAGVGVMVEYEETGLAVKMLRQLNPHRNLSV